MDEEFSIRAFLEQSRDIIVHLPLGAYLEREDLTKQIIERGRTQVTLGSFFGKIIVRQTVERSVQSIISQSEQLSDPIYKIIEPLMTTLKGVSSSDSQEPDSDKPVTGTSSNDTKSVTTQPWENYDVLTAKEIIEILKGSSEKVKHITSSYESLHKNRKSIIQYCLKNSSTNITK